MKLVDAVMPRPTILDPADVSAGRASEHLAINGVRSLSAVSFIAMLLLAAASTLRAADWAGESDMVLALGHLTNAPAIQDAEGFPPEGNMKAVFLDALPWKGKPTKVFAWLGLPKKSTGKVPGIVLVHGGGGTAFKEWVRKWNDLGFAAISIAVEGQTDRRFACNQWEDHAWPGPKRKDIYGDSAEPLTEQWIYHAVADSILANSLLRSLPGVDSERVGIMGISWGGVITGTAIGIDPRFAFAIPTYGRSSL